jgi:hypothetical protein
MAEGIPTIIWDGDHCAEQHHQVRPLGGLHKYAIARAYLWGNLL